MLALVLVVLAADPNADGFAEYKKGNYAKAAPLFDKAIKTQPKNAWAWLNRARTLALLAKGKEPDDYCDYGKNWVLLALDALEHAVELDKAKVLAKLEEPDPGTEALKARREVRDWLAAVTYDGDAAKLLAAQPDWHSTEEPGAVPKNLTLDAKSWKVTGGKLSLVENGKSVPYEVKVQPWYFDEGKRHFSVLQLQGPTVWALGPVLADCD